MRRRDFIAVFCMSAAWPLAVRAQQSSKVYRIALVSPARHLSEMSEDGPDFGIIFRELRRLGYVEGNNLVVLRFSAEGDPARYDPMIHDVVSAAPDVIVTANNPLVLRFKALEHSIPVVAMMGDPLAFGIVASLARPEGNITGISADAGEETGASGWRCCWRPFRQQPMSDFCARSHSGRARRETRCVTQRAGSR
jgi:putative ABC transport system substrate-binding protein